MNGNGRGNEWEGQPPKTIIYTWMPEINNTWLYALMFSEHHKTKHNQKQKIKDGFTKSQVTVQAAVHMKGKLMFSSLKSIHFQLHIVHLKNEYLPVPAVRSVNLVHKVFPFTSFLRSLLGTGCVHKLMSCVVANLNMNHARILQNGLFQRSSK